MDALLDESSRVVSDLVGHAIGEIPGKSLHLGGDSICDGDGICAGGLINGHDGPVALIVAAEGIGGFRTQFDAANILDPDEGAVGIGANNSILELRNLNQATLGLDVELVQLVVSHRLRADASHGGLDVLSLEGIDDIVRRNPQACQPVALDPDAHAVLQAAKQERIADPGDPLDVVEDIDRRVVVEEQRVVGAFFLRIEVDDLQQRRGFLLHIDAGPRDFLRQLAVPPGPRGSAH